MSEILSLKYGLFFIEGQRLRIDAGEPSELHLEVLNVPRELETLLPYAEFWGVADDSCRIELINQAPPEVWRDFQIVVSRHKTALLDWLSGPEADHHPTREYLAFSFMQQAFDWPRSCIS